MRTLQGRKTANAVQRGRLHGRTCCQLWLKDCGGGYKALPGAGNVFIENCTMNASFFVPGQKVWARQFNPEAIGGARADSGLVVNDGADLWVLGMKTEGTWTVVRSVNGARTELLGEPTAGGRRIKRVRNGAELNLELSKELMNRSSFLDFLSSRGFPLRSVFQGRYERRFRLKAVHQRGMCSDDRWCPGFSRSGEREGKKEGNNSQ